MSFIRTFSEIYQEVIRNVGLNPSQGRWIELGKKWVNSAYMEINNRKDWPWLMRRGSFSTEALLETGTVSVTNGSRTVTGDGTAFESKHVGQVLMIDQNLGYKYIVLSVESATSLTLEIPYIGESGSGLSSILWTKFYSLSSEAKQVSSMRRINGIPLTFKFKEDFEKFFPHAHTGALSFWTQWGLDYKIRQYSTGTIEGTTGTNTITGTDTAWLGNVCPGDLLVFDEYTYHVKTVDSDTVIKIVETVKETASSTSYTITSEKAPTIMLSSTPNPRELIEYEYVIKTYPLISDSEVPNLPQQFFDTLVVGGMQKGFEYLSSEKYISYVAQFEAEMKKMSLYWDVTYKPDTFAFGAEAYMRVNNVWG
jgi:hypothetical protein